MRKLRISKTLPLFFLILATVFIGSADSAPIARRPRKNPKLSTRLDELARAVPQRTVPPATGEKIAAPKGFVVQKLPKSIRDAVRARMMRINKDAEVQVYIEVNKITEANLAQLRALGVTVQILGEPKPNKAEGEVLTAVPTVQALLPVSMINQVAGLSFVRYVRLPDYGFANTGSVDSQGDSLLKADLARQQLGVDGTGVKVGVISTGLGGIFDPTTCSLSTEIPNPIQTGDLPSATPTCTNGVLTGVTGGITAQSFPSSSPNLMPLASDTASGYAAEGTAMLEIVHDLAPGAQLFFANPADGTSMSFEQAVDWLDSRVDVGVDDLSFLYSDAGVTYPYDGTSNVSLNTATDLNTDTNPIRVYLTAVGNQVFNHWGEPWTDSGVDFNFGDSNCTQPLGNGDVQLFERTANTQDMQNLGTSLDDVVEVPGGSTLIVVLRWNDPSGSVSDYALYLNFLPLDAPDSPSDPLPNFGSCIAEAMPGTAPADSVAWSNPYAGTAYVGIYIQNVANQASPRAFDMFVRETATGNSPNLNFYTPSGSVPAEADAGGSPVSVVSVGATDAQTDASGNAPATLIEPYSSQGPTEATPQASARMKPDISATDDVSVTGAGGFGMNGSYATATGGCAIGETPCYFPGTSAAAPHAAAVAALVLQAAPCLLSSSTVNTPAAARANLRNFLTSTAAPLPGVSQATPNDIEGYGLLDAFAAVSAAMPTANAGTAQTVNAASSSGATVKLSGSGTDPDSCPLTMTWGGSCGNVTGANPSVNCPIGNDTETLTVSNGGAIAGLPTNNVQITVSDFTVTSTQTTASVSPGQSASYTVNVGQEYGDFTNPVSLTCLGLPSEASCSFSPASVTPGSGTATSTLTISTTAPSSIFPLFGPGGPDTRLLALWLGLLLAFTALVVFTRKSGRKIGFGIASCALLIFLAAPAISCGGGGSSAPKNPGTPAGTYSVTVTGVSNQLKNLTTVSLTVQ